METTPASYTNPILSHLWVSHSSPIWLPWWLSWWRTRLWCRRPWFYSWVGKIHCRRDRLPTPVFLGFPCGSSGKESTCNAGDLGLIPGLGRSPGEGKGHPLQYSGLENSMDCIVHGAAKSWTWLNAFHFHFPGQHSWPQGGGFALISGFGKQPLSLQPAQLSVLSCLILVGQAPVWAALQWSSFVCKGGEVTLLSSNKKSL